MICPHTLYQLHLTKVPDTPLDTFERLIGVTLLFDNIPRVVKSEKQDYLQRKKYMKRPSHLAGPFGSQAVFFA